MDRIKFTDRIWYRFLPYLLFLVVFVSHAGYHVSRAAAPATGWEGYLQAQDFYIGFSYAVSAAFTTWALQAYLQARDIAVAVGAAGGVTVIGVLLACGCFLTGCCGSPMLAVYAALFGAKALGVGKPMMACLTGISVAASYWYLSEKLSRGCCRKEGSCHTG